MSSVHGQIDYWMNRSQTFERIMATMVGWLNIDAFELAPLQPYNATSAQPSRHTSGQGSMFGQENEADDIDDA